MDTTALERARGALASFLDASPSSEHAVAANVVPRRGASITLDHVGKVYANGAAAVHALDDVTLAIEPGEIFGIIGRSGAGKSTLVRCINLLEQPSSGSVKVGGIDLARLDANALRAARRRIGMIFQHFNLLASRTVADNVALPLEFEGRSRGQIKRRVSELLELVGLAGLGDRYVAQVSGGQKQRIGIARALASEPDVLLSDEATSALDPETTRAILALLRDINQRFGLTIVMITHQMPVVQAICHRVAVLDAGRVVEHGPVRNVFGHPSSEAARALIGQAVGQSVPADTVRALLQDSDGTASVWRVTLRDDARQASLLGALARKFNLDVSIVQAHVEDFGGAALGSLLLAVRGDAAQIALAYAWARSGGWSVEEVTHVA